jgi:transcriptional regulator with XRE-family HTH domain
MENRIKTVRVSRGMNQADMADLIGVTVASISAYETGIRNPSNTTISVLCDKLGINEGWLRTGSGPMLRETPQTIIDELARRYALSQDAVRILYIIAQAFQRLTPEQAHEMVEIARRNLLADDPAAAVREAIEKSPDDAGPLVMGENPDE